MFGLNEIWFLLGIPLLVTIIIALFYFKKAVWWEYCLIWGVSIISILLAQAITESTAISDKELWGFNGVKAEYEEPFSYWSTCTETYACGTTCSGSGSSRSCSTRYCTRTYPCVKHGGDTARLFDQTGRQRWISKSKFLQLEKSKWANSETIELHREQSYNIINDGDLRVTVWPGDWRNAQPIVEGHTYENRTQSSTTMRFKKVSEDDKLRFGLFDYPHIENLECPTVIDSSGNEWAADIYFKYVNGTLGPKKFLRIWVLIFRDQPREAMLYQEGYWKNGNKNEFIICVGADKNDNVTWGGVISWTEVEELKVEFRNYVELEMKKVSDESLMELAYFADENLGARYVKPEFTEKFKHLSVQPSKTSMVIVAVIILLINIGIAAYVVCNDVDH